MAYNEQPATKMTIPGQKITPATPTAQYMRLAAKRLLPRTLMGGTDAMREAGEKYLPKFPAEDSMKYQSRLKNTFLFNAFIECVKKLASKLFKEPIKLTKTVPQSLVDFSENVDGEGRALNQFMYDMAEDAFADGVAYWLVDAPQVQAGATKADQVAAKWRPYWVPYLADDVIEIQSEMVNGTQVLSRVRLKECAYEQVGEWGQTKKERIRVLKPGEWELYEAQKQNDGTIAWVSIDKGTTALKEIPLVPLYTNRTGFYIGEPPLTPLADLNHEHWISSSEQRHALQFGRYGMLVAVGVPKPMPKKRVNAAAREETEEGIKVGPTVVFYVPLHGDVKVVEPTGKALEAGANDLVAIERRMEHAGATLRVDKKGDVTATAAAIGSDDMNSGLRSVSAGMKDALEIAMWFTAQILGEVAGGGDVEVYNSFGEVVVEATPDQLLKMWVANAISLETLWTELKRRGVLSENFDPLKEKSLVEAEVSAALKQMIDTMKTQNGPTPTPPRQKPTKPNGQ